MEDKTLDFIDAQPNTARPAIIKVIGVGGAGGNAVRSMHNQGIIGVDLIVCNTDLPALSKSPVPVKLQIGPNLTRGRGVGGIPERGKEAAIESLDQIHNILGEYTDMVFLTAGMGGGTGTGATPEIAKEAKEMGILTVAIVTIPAVWEGEYKKELAIKGIHELKPHVDSIIVISNEKIFEEFADVSVDEAFIKADEVLANAVRGIAETITILGDTSNIDFADVDSVMRNSRAALMGSAACNGEKRGIKAVEAALFSPLLNNNSIYGATKLLIHIIGGEKKATMDEIKEISNHIRNLSGNSIRLTKMQDSVDPSLGDKIKLNIVAVGFPEDKIETLQEGKEGRDIISNIKKEHNEMIIKDTQTDEQQEPSIKGIKIPEPKTNDNSNKKTIDEAALKKLSEKPAQVPDYKRNLAEIEEIPAYKRRNLEEPTIKIDENPTKTIIE